MAKYIEFNFAIYEITEEQADLLLNRIIHEVETMNMSMGGGWTVKDDNDGQEKDRNAA